MRAPKARIFKWLIVLLLLVQGDLLQAQLSADFTATPVVGCSPIVVRFTDISTGSPTSWKWDLGNGTISFLHNPSVTYFTPGQYNVKLVIANAAGKDSVTKLQYITVYARPVSDFSVSGTTGCFPLPVQFTDLSVAGSGDLTKWEWDFGDGLNATDLNAQHIYKTAGTFNVSLRVTNSFGCTRSLTKPKLIKINTGVLAGFEINTSNSCKAPATINFTNTSTGSGTLSYQWDFGDGKGSALGNPSHVYTADGNYKVRLIVKNSTGCTDTLTKLNAIILGNTSADFSAPGKICAGVTANIINTSRPLASGVLWNFGDGSVSTDTTPVKAYNVPGTYVIKMVVNFGACSDSVSKSIVVLAKPVINFSANKTNDCKVPFTVNFTQNISGGASYLWDFGDSTSSAIGNPTHIYQLPGERDVKLIATNTGGCTDTLIKPAFIQVKLPEVTLPNLPVSGCAPFTFTFASTTVAISPVISYKWNFGDGSVSSSAAPSHTFLQPGNYTISLIITTAGGCTDTVTMVNGVVVGSRPVASFNATPRNTCASFPVNFSDLSTGKPDEWKWQFGDGNTSTEQNPSHFYADTGYFNITLVALNNGCTDTIVINNYIHINAPVANFLVGYVCPVPLQRVFTDRSIAADTWLWDFGDGDTSTLRSPVHNYSSAGNFLVKLTVTNASTGCSYTKAQMISVITEKANFSASDSVICKGSSINVSTVNINGGNISSYFWNFGDGTAYASSSGLLPHTYTTAGTYSVKLIINDNLGCTDTLIKPLYIRVDGPSASFTPSAAGSCINSAVTFLDSSYSDGMHNIQQWLWDYGDGISDTLSAPPFKHSYSSAGIFTVRLKIIDSKGCTDTLTKSDALIISTPVADFSTIDTISCPQKSITFTNNSAGPALTYLWNFGDGSTSSQLNPVHQYSTQGLFSISLSITDQYGCTDYLIKKDYVKIVIPAAAFSMSDSVSNCPPLAVTFTNTSSNAISSLWDFGDGNTSVVDSPSHFYAFPGVYNVTLTITSAGNCTDQVTKQIKIKGPSGSFNYTNISGCNPLQTSFTSSSKNTSYIIWDFNDGTTVNSVDPGLTHQYINPGIYLPKIILVDTGGCQVPIVGADTIVVYGVQANFNILPVVLCDSGSVSFIDNSISNDLITSYLWSFGDSTTSAEQHPVHSYKKTGLYNSKLIISTQAGCADSLKIASQVKVVNSPKIAMVANGGSCIPAILNFSGKLLTADTSALSWNWDFGNGSSSTMQNPPYQIFSSANNYSIQLVATNSSGCVSVVNKTINTYPIPAVKIFADSFLCSGKSMNLVANGAAAYSWTPALNLSCTNCANPVAKPDSAIQYRVTGTSVNGCSSSDSISITIKYPFKIQVSKRDTLCAGKSTVLNARGGENYVWSPATGLNNPLLASPVAMPMQTTNYRVVASDNIGCYSDTGYVPVKVYPMPTVNAGEDKTINVGKSIELDPVISSDVTTVDWSPTSGIFRNSYPGISVKPNESTEYTVEVSNTGGCLARDRVTVNVLCNNSNVFLPNTFSPNGDGANDIFYPRGSGVFQIKLFKIFNRWGEVVFEKSNIAANDVSSGWDGTSKGQKLLPDVFVYIMDVVCDNNTTLTFKGNIALIR